MANYVQPKAHQKKIVAKKVETNEGSKIAEEIKVEQAISNLEKVESQEGDVDLTKEIQSAPIRGLNEEVKADEQLDEALVK